MQGYIYQAIVQLTKLLVQTLAPEDKPFDQARNLILHTMFAAMAAQRHLIPDQLSFDMSRAENDEIISLLTNWDVGKTFCGVPTITFSDSLISVLRSIFVHAEKETWPSYWLGNLVDEVDIYAKHHGEDGAQASYSRRHNGIYYTNSQLVKLVVKEALKSVISTQATASEILSLKVIDPAVGGASFLVEIMHQLAQILHDLDGRNVCLYRREVLRCCIYGIDIDPFAVMVARCTLWLEAEGGNTHELLNHLIVGDSLLDSNLTDVEQFDIVIGNPPWNKIKVDIKEFYGHYNPIVFEMQGNHLKQYVQAEFAHRPAIQLQWQKHRKNVQSYLDRLLTSAMYSHQNIHQGERLTNGDPDLYKFFLERFLQLARPGGRIALLLPASLCTAKGAVELRRMLLTETGIEAFVTLENKDRSFPIDTRFKYLILVAEKGKGPSTILPGRFMLPSVYQAELCLTEGDLLPIPVELITTLSPDNLTFVDVRDRRDIQLLKKFDRLFPPLGTYLPDSWNVRFIREMDMTNDSHLFRDRNELEQQGYWHEANGCYRNSQGKEMVPLIEGRMVHQFDSAFKAYVRGHGRKAIWRELAWDQKQIIPHFYVEQEVAVKIQGYGMPRAGYCDVTGQTNERTVLAALIAGECVAGNKVPTLRIEKSGVSSLHLSLLWLAIANSFVVDWLMRMRMSTTINYFHWYQIPFPRILPADPRATELIAASTWLSTRQREEELPELLEGWVPLNKRPHGVDHKTWLSQFIRAELDARVAALYDLSVHDYAYMLTTFPLLDRIQPSLSGDFNAHKRPQSYITRDLALLTYCRHKKVEPPEDLVAFFNQIGICINHVTGELCNLEERVKCANSIGAVAYVPTGNSFS